MRPEFTALQADTLAAKLKRRRLERGLRQIDAAREMGVAQHSVIDWEGGKEPMIGQYPAIIAFLAYEPWPEPQTLSEKLKAERRRRGWSLKCAAASIGVDEGTFGAWEAGFRRPTRRGMLRALQLVKGVTGSAISSFDPSA